MIEKAVGGWLATAVVLAAWQALTTVYADFLGLYGLAATLAAVATIVTSLGVIGLAVRRVVRMLARAGNAITVVLHLDKELAAHLAESERHWSATAERLDQGDRRMASIEHVLDTLALAERAAVRGALEAVQTQRPGLRAERTDADGGEMP